MRREQAKQYLLRANKFVEGIQKRGIIGGGEPLSARVGQSGEPVSFSERLKLKYRDIKVGETWGRDFDCGWFHIKGQVPACWAGKHVALHLDLKGESCVFDMEGTPVYGMTSGSVFANHSSKDLYLFLRNSKGGEEVEFWVEAGANGLFGLTREGDPAENCPTRYGSYEGIVRHLELVTFNEDAWGLMLDLTVLLSFVKGCGDEEGPRRNSVIRGIHLALDAYADDVGNARKARAVLKDIFDVPANPADLNVTAVGHAHIDTGWLWPVRETIRKSGRTFASQISLIEKYPDYVFGASQPQHYQMVKEHYPKLYEKIKAAIKKGRWECQGGMWVEADCNIISGESMVRQFLHGKNFFMDEFGIDVKNLWLPDVFGYSAAMPQIMKRSGVDYFLTQKISWSQFNEFPHNTFMWEGIDGTRVLTHFPPENNYNSTSMPGPHMQAQQRFKENSFITEYMSLFGIGDGGGGPKEEHVETSRRMAALNGAPKVRLGTAAGFFDRISKHSAQLQTWVGELYLECHRGTLTTQARTKLGNRRLEKALRDVEMICSLLPLERYPAGELDMLWKTLLINQFHDIIPGSSITRVYKETEAQYAQSLKKCGELIAGAAEYLLATDRESLTLFNSLSVDFAAPVILPDRWSGFSVLNAAGGTLPSQPVGRGTAVQVTIPALSFITLKRGLPADSTVKDSASMVLENDLVCYGFDEDGTIESIFDKESGKSLMPVGEKGNLLSLYVDRPANWDAWDCDIYYQNERIEHAACSVKPKSFQGPVCDEIHFSLSIGSSVIEQVVRLPKDSKRIDFVTRVKWQEKHKMLRVSFPTTVRSELASFDIQYGYVSRNTHDNTSWDMAKFEVAAHKFADISDNDHGVAILNDCKYGHKVKGHTLDLNLLRSPNDPDPDADQGAQEFTYALLPHSGRMIDSDVQSEAAMLNRPPIAMDGYAAKSVTFPVAVSGKGISMEVLKKAEKEDCRILRLVETAGRESRGRITFAGRFKSITETNLVEWADGESAACGAGVDIVLSPFEIRTYKLW